MADIQRRIFVSGWVQGVGFRQAAVEEAEKYSSVRGFVRNLMDGRVEIVFAGPSEAVIALQTWCKTGPPRSSVTDISVKDEPVDPALITFSIQRDR